jgi:cytoskeleton protein RodZ
LNQDQGISLGSHLRQERERRNASLESIAQVTRISLNNLEAMERDEFHLLPAPVFVRGFLRTYATHLGIDPKEVLARYEVQTDSSKASLPKKIALSPKKIRPLVKITLFVLALGLPFYFFYSKTPTPLPSPPVSTPEAPRLPAPPDKTYAAEESSSPRKDLLGTPAVSAPPPTPSPALSEDPKKKERRHVLKIKAKETTWLRIQTDDQQEVDALLQPQETATWTARRQFKVTICNAGGVDVSFNGVLQGPLGDFGEVVHLRLPKEIKKKGMTEGVNTEEVKEP